MHEPVRKTIPEQLTEALEEVARLRAENLREKSLATQLAEARSQLETAKSANAGLISEINTLRTAPKAKQVSATTVMATKSAGNPLSSIAQAEIGSMEAEVATKKAELSAARAKRTDHDMAEIERLEVALAAARATLSKARTELAHARLDADLAVKVHQHVEAGTFRSDWDMEDSDRVRQANVIAATTRKLDSEAARREQVAEGYREKYGIT
jgi:hypothetical protein